MKSFTILSIVLIVGSHTIDSARILGLFIHPAISHWRAFQPILKALADNGHDVFVVTHFSDKVADKPQNYHEFLLDQDGVLTGTAPVDEVRLV